MLIDNPPYKKHVCVFNIFDQESHNTYVFFIFREPKIKNTYVLLAPISRRINVFFLVFFVSFFHVDTQKIKNTHVFQIIENKTMKTDMCFQFRITKISKTRMCLLLLETKCENTYVFLLRWNNVPGKNIFWFFLLVTSSAVAFLKPWKKVPLHGARKPKKIHTIQSLLQHNKIDATAIPNPVNIYKIIWIN